jgi:HEAT repeats
VSRPAPSADPSTRARGLRALAIVAALTVAIVASRATSHTHDTADNTASRATAPRAGCRFAVDDLRAWKLTQRFTEASRDRVDVSAVVATRTVAVDARTLVARHAARIATVESSDATIRERLVALRGVTFEVRTAADCTFAAMGFARDVPAASAEVARGLLRPFEVVLPTGEVPSHWSAQQREGEHTVAVRYTRLAEGFFTRERLRYVGRATGASDATPEITRSSSRFTVARDGRWISALDGLEETRLSGATVRNALELRAVDADWTGDAPTLASLDALDFTEPAAPPSTEPAAVDATDPSLALALDDALAHLGALYARRRNGAADEALRFMVAYLRAHPERADEILQRIRRRAYPEELGAMTFFAMSRVRDPRVRAGLVRVVEDDGYLQQERVRASFAVADSAFADVDAVTRLARVADRSHATPDDELVTDAALNAIGTLRAHATGDVAEAATGVLRDALREARTPEALADAVNAIGNAGDPTFLGAVRDAAASDAPHVRESAATALASMEDPTVEALLRERLRVETEPSVIVAVVRAIARRTGERPSDDTVAVAIAKLPVTADVDARLALVELIGSSVGWNGVARAALAAWFARERDARVQVAIGRYVPAEALSPRP